MPGIVFTESSNLNNSIYGAVQAPVQEIILNKAKTMEERETAMKHVFKFTNSEHFAESYTDLTSMGGFMPTPEAGAVNITGMQEGFAKIIKNFSWTNSFRISPEIIEDSKAVDLKARPEAFVAAYYATRERFAAAAIGAALQGQTAFTFGGMSFDASSADGVAAFAAAHPSAVDAGYTQSNICSNALTADNLGLVETAMQNLKDDNGESLTIAPTTIVIPNLAAAKKAAFVAAGSYSDPTNDTGAFNYQVGRWNIVVWQQLNDYLPASMVASGAFPWFLVDEDYKEDVGGAIFQDRKALAVDSYEDKNTYCNIWRGRARFGVGIKDFRAMFAGGIASASALS